MVLQSHAVCTVHVDNAHDILTSVSRLLVLVDIKRTEVVVLKKRVSAAVQQQVLTKLE